MNMVKTVALALLAGAVSFSAMAAQEVTKEQVESMKLEKIATVTTTAEVSSPMDAKEALSKLADEKGGKYFMVIAGREHGKISATADVYK